MHKLLVVTLNFCPDVIALHGSLHKHRNFCYLLSAA